MRLFSYTDSFLAGLDFSACEVQNIGEIANLNPQIFFKWSGKTLELR